MDKPQLIESVRRAARADFSRSGGPGGQNVNKVNSKVNLRLRLDDLAGLNDAEMERLRLKLASRINGEGELVVSASEERSQRINLERAYARTESLILGAASLPRVRRPTKPGRAAKEERLRSKRLLAAKKAERRPAAEE